jgi:hypothetical protein
VMEAIRREAAAPQPIPFPWVRALPGLAACLTILVLAVGSGVSRGAGTEALPDLGRLAAIGNSALAAAARTGVGWIALALSLTWGSVTLSMRLTGWRR